jgi:hypothetical protein
MGAADEAAPAIVKEGVGAAKEIVLTNQLVQPG